MPFFIKAPSSEIKGVDVPIELAISTSAECNLPDAREILISDFINSLIRVKDFSPIVPSSLNSVPSTSNTTSLIFF